MSVGRIELCKIELITGTTLEILPGQLERVMINLLSIPI